MIANVRFRLWCERLERSPHHVSRSARFEQGTLCTHDGGYCSCHSGHFSEDVDNIHRKQRLLRTVHGSLLGALVAFVRQSMIGGPFTELMRRTILEINRLRLPPQIRIYPCASWASRVITAFFGRFRSGHRGREAAASSTLIYSLTETVSTSCLG
jgi:hypothetical protein